MRQGNLDLDTYTAANCIIEEGSLKEQDKIHSIEANIAHKSAARMCHKAMRQT